jgi:hypothetical protein
LTTNASDKNPHVILLTEISNVSFVQIEAQTPKSTKKHNF